MDAHSKHVADLLPFDDAKTDPVNDSPDADNGLEAVLHWFQDQADVADRFGAVLRQSIDEVLDGQRTRRFDIDSLEKTEKTYLGTKVEIVARSEFDLGYGASMDYLVAEQEVDAKFTSGTKSTNWTIPGEAMGHLCLLMAADEHQSVFKVGLVRIGEDNLNSGRNKDGKRTLNVAGRTAIRWLVPHGRLPQKLLLSMSEDDRHAIFHASDAYRGGGNGGQLRTDMLFRRALGRLVDRDTVLTVASQEDSPKRVRDARQRLRSEGIVILGHLSPHPDIARALQLEAPAKGAYVAARLARHINGDPRPSALIGGVAYVLHREGEIAEAPEKY